MRRVWPPTAAVAIGLALVSTAASKPRPRPAPIARHSVQTLAITPPADVTAPVVGPCSVGSSSYCAVVIFSYGFSGGVPPYHLVCNFDSPAVLLMGHHTISCIGQDSEADSTPPSTFEATVTPAVTSFSPTSGGLRRRSRSWAWAFRT